MARGQAGRNWGDTRRGTRKKKKLVAARDSGAAEISGEGMG
jgi:hypothetical protein